MDKFQIFICEDVKTSKYKKFEIPAKSSVELFPEDKISEFKEKMYILTDIPPFRQHWYVLDDDYALPLYYNVLVGGLVVCDIRTLEDLEASNQPLVGGVPVDARLYEESENLVIEGMDVFMTLGKLQELYDSPLYCVDMEQFIGEQTRKELLQDEEQMKIVYYGFIAKFYPMLTLEAFQAYLKEDGFASSYPELIPKLQYLKGVYEVESTEMAAWKKLLNMSENIKKFALHARDISKVGESVLKVSIRDVHITSSKISLTAGSKFLRKKQKWNYGNAFFDMESLFKNIHATEFIPLIRVKLVIENRIVALSKVYEKNIHYSIFKNNLDERIFNSALFVMKTGDEKYITLIIRDGGYYEVIVNWSEHENVDFNIINSSVVNTVNPFINTINNLGRNVFVSSDRLVPLSLHHILYKNINLTLIYNVSMTGAEFLSLDKYVNSLKLMNIVRTVPPELLGEIDVPGNSFSVIFSKGMYEEDTSSLNIVTQNWYSFMSDAGAKTEWMSAVLGGRIVRFIHNTNNIKINVDYIQEGEFMNFYRLISAILIKNSKALPITKAVRAQKVENNLIGILKQKDPELFAFNMKGKIKDYSRLSQKSNQPIPYTESEYLSLPETDKKRATKYWNFTTKKPMYYICPNPKYPYVNFITGKHPKNYCLPSCKKTNPLAKSGTSAKSAIYNTCILEHSLTTEKSTNDQTRYIVNYGKEVDINRISSLPEMLEKWIQYNTKEMEERTDKQELDDIENVQHGDKKYAVKKIWQITRNNIVRMIPIEQLEHELDVRLWVSPIRADVKNSTRDILEKPKLNSAIYTSILNVDMGHPLVVDYDEQTKTAKLFEGILRLAKYKNEGSTLVPCKFITPKQIEKSVFTGSVSQISSNIKKILRKTIHHPNYYLLGVSQENGLMNSIAECLSKTSEEMINELSVFIASEKNSISAEHSNTNISEMLLSYEISEVLLFKVIRMLYKINVIILEDKITMYETSKISVMFPYDINNIEEIFPDTETGEYSFVLVLKRTKVDALTSEDTNSFYPIFIITPQDYFKNMAVKKKIFNLTDEIIKICKSSASESLASLKSSTTLTAGNLHKLYKQTKNSYIDKIYINGSGYSYAASVVLEGEKLIVPVEYSYSEIFEDIENVVGIYKQVNKDIKLIRKYIDAIDLYKDKFISDIYVKDENVMGFKLGNLIYEVITDAGQFIKIMDRFINANTFVVPIAVGYHEIDVSIFENGITEPEELKDVPKYVEELNSYGLFVMGFMSAMDLERNEHIRKQIENIIRASTFTNRKETMEKIMQVVTDPHDLNKIDGLMDDFYKRKLSKQETLDLFKNSGFIFDKITIHKLMDAVDGYKLMSKSKQEKARKLVKEIVQGVVQGVIGSSKENVNALVDEIINPFRRWYIFNASYKVNLRGLLGYEKHPDENIYVNIL